MVFGFITTDPGGNLSESASQTIEEDMALPTMPLFRNAGHISCSRHNTALDNDKTCLDDNGELVYKVP